jgi:hypothetical protein
MTLVFKKNYNYFAKNLEKLQKIVIITSTPDELAKKLPEICLNPNECVLFTVEKSSRKSRAMYVCNF